MQLWTSGFNLPVPSVFYCSTWMDDAAKDSIGVFLHLKRDEEVEEEQEEVGFIAESMQQQEVSEAAVATGYLHQV